MYILQCYDYEDGNGAMWYDLHNARFESYSETRDFMRAMRAKDDESCTVIYRVVAENSDERYNQPTDRAEY